MCKIIKFRKQRNKKVISCALSAVTFIGINNMIKQIKIQVLMTSHEVKNFFVIKAFLDLAWSGVDGIFCFADS